MASDFGTPEEDQRLRSAFARLPKTPRHGATLAERHGDVLPEWVMRIIADPYDRYTEINDGREITILVGRVPASRRWIKVIFIGTPETGQFHTAYRDRRLDRQYGGGPWSAR